MTGVAIPDDVGIAVLGDVHGNADRLERALSELATEDRLVIMVGDYINRGPDSRRVMDLLLAAREELRERLVLLRGNHEVALMSFLNTGDPTGFLRHKGVTTVSSYCANPGPDVLQDFRRGFPQAHLRLLESMPTHAEGSALLVTHAGFNPAKPQSRTEADITTGHWPELLASPPPPAPRPLVVFGHYTSLNGIPYDGGHLVGLDTGCGADVAAPLTALRMPERRFSCY
jgi:serine/threonine protein phosphatase 1